MKDQKHKSNRTTKISAATVSKLLGLGSLLLSGLILSYAAFISIQALQSPPPPAAIVAAAPKSSNELPALQLNSVHQRQGALVVAPIAPSGRSDPFLP